MKFSSHGGVGGSRTRVLNTSNFSSFTRLVGYLTPTNSASRAIHFFKRSKKLWRHSLHQIYSIGKLGKPFGHIHGAPLAVFSLQGAALPRDYAARA